MALHDVVEDLSGLRDRGPGFKTRSGVQSIYNVFHIVNKVESVLENTYIFDLMDNVEYVVYALYSSDLDH